MVEYLLDAALVLAGLAVVTAVTTLTRKLFGVRPKTPQFQVNFTECDYKMMLETQNLIQDDFSKKGESIVQTMGDLSVEERKKKAESFVTHLANLYGISAEVEWFTDSIERCGNYNNGIIRLNDAELQLPPDTPEYESQLRNFVDSIVHECRHAVQINALLSPGFWNISDENLMQWYNNLRNYIPSVLDLRGYCEQPVEADAFAFAATILKGVQFA